MNGKIETTLANEDGFLRYQLSPEETGELILAIGPGDRYYYPALGYQVVTPGD
jgi:hypothetical protein